MRLPIYQLDVFTENQFHGNPAAVIPLESWLPEETMQKIASENSLYETAFFVKSGDAYDIRWFTPRKESDLCGHATLAAAYVILNHIGNIEERVLFRSPSGDIEVWHDDGLYAMSFPKLEITRCEMPYELVLGLGKLPKASYKSRDYLLIYDDEDQILGLDPDLEELQHVQTSGIIVTAKGQDCDYVLRYFAPSMGLNEDPAAGSAQCTLVPYWAQALGKTEFVVKQLSRRGGTIYCKDLGDKVQISGKVMTYLEGFIYI